MASPASPSSPPVVTEEDKLVGAWTAATGGVGSSMDTTALEDEPKSSDRLLSQSEIDGLLGTKDKGSTQDISGIRALINSGLVSYERLPMLEVVFDRLVRMVSTSLRNFTSDNVDVSLEQITSVRFGDYLDSIPLPAMLAVFKAEEWDNSGLMTIDSAMIYSTVDVLLGGRSAVAMRVEGRTYTTIERNMVERLVRLVLADVSAAFDPLSSVTFRFDRLETNPQFATIARPANAAVLVKIRVDMEGRGGRIEILIPYATLEPIRELLLQMFMGEKFGRDSIWETHLGQELLLTDMNIHAVLAETTLTLGDVIHWEVGSRVMLDVQTDDQVRLCAGNVTLFEGRMGSFHDHLAVRVENVCVPVSPET